MINLGNVVGVLRSTTPPNKKYVLWAKILNPLFPDVVELNYWDEINLAWVPLTDSTTQHWLRPVLDIRASPPLSPIEGDRYLISPTGASGAFLAKENQVATYRNSSWQFQIPLDGYIVSVRTEANKLYDFRGTYGSGGAWYENDFQVPIAPGTYIPSTEKGLPNGVVPLGPDTKIDSTYLNANTLPFTPVNSGQWPIGTDTVREGLEYLRSVVSGAVYIPNLNEVLGSGNNAGNQFLVNVQGIGVGILSPTAKVHFRGTGAGTNPLFRLENSSIVDLYTMLENGVSTYAAVVKYASDISGTFDNLSLVHKQYVDAAVAGATPGLIQLDWQITPPVGISNKTTVWADSSGRINWRIGTGGSSWIRTFDATGITANRVYSFPDQSGTLAIAANHWSLATGAVLTGPNTISGPFNIGFTNNAVGFGVAAGSVPTDTRVFIKAAGFAGLTLPFHIVSSLDQNLFYVTDDGSGVFAKAGIDFQSAGNILIKGSYIGRDQPTGVRNQAHPICIGTGGGFGGNQNFLDSTIIRPGGDLTSGTSNDMTGALGDSNNLRVTANVVPNNSNRLSQIRIDPTINVAGGSPTLIGFDYQPVITALGTATHLASRWASGSHVFGGTTLTNASLIIDIQSTTQAFALPRMTSTQRDAIASPATGAMLFVNDNPLQEGIHFFDLHWRKCVTKNQILSVTSKNITQSVLDNIEIPNSVVVTVEAEVQFIQTSGTVGSSAIYYRIQRTFRKTSAGTLAAVAATTTLAFANDTGDTFTTLPQLVINANAVCVQYDISASTKTFNVKASVNYHFSN